MKKMEVYKCGDGVLVEVIKDVCCCGDSCHDLFCCGETMKLQRGKYSKRCLGKHVSNN